MKRLSLIVLVGIFVVGLISTAAFAQTGPEPAEDSDDTYVRWILDAPMQCELTIDAHSGIDLGVLDEIGVTYTASGAGYGSGNRRVNAESNCPFTVSVEVTGVTAPITGGQVLDDFLINAVNRSGGTTRKSIGSIWNNWHEFTNYNDSIEFGSAGNTDYSQYSNVWFEMDYSYETDYDDVNDEAYRVDLQYTASTD